LQQFDGESRVRVATKKPRRETWANDENDSMPFKSEKQRRYLYAKEPAIARSWASKYGNKTKGGGKKKGGKKK